jgi:enterochelin esterase family protein
MNWATLGSTPFRRFKHFTHEGGIAVPLIAHWPRGIPARRRNAVVREPAHLVDVMPTILEAAGAAYPREFRGQAIQPMEGVSLRPALAGRVLARTQPLFWEHEGNRAVRSGQWKLVSTHLNAWELYDMTADRVERNDLAASRPDLVRTLAAAWDAWAARANVDPWVGPPRLPWGDAAPPPSAVQEVGARLTASEITSPEVAADRRVTFRLRAPEAKAVKVSGDFGADADMQRSDDGVWTATVGPLDPESYVYFFIADGVRLPDPGNPQVKIGYVTTTTSSLLTVPGDRPAFYDVQDVPHGEIRTLLYKSRSNGVTRELTVYVPPGYDKAPGLRYPVLYLLHGFANDQHSWHRYGRANDILDNLLAQRAIAPFLVVMPLGYGGAHVNGDGTGIAPQGAGGPRGDAALYERDLLEDIVPMIDSTYRTVADRKHRAIMGFSMGGGQAGRFGLRHLETFSHVGIMSAGLGGGGSTIAPGSDPIAPLAVDPVKTNTLIDLLWIACGKDDAAMKGARALHEALAKAGIEHTFLETEGAHHWRVWRRYLHDVAPLLFKGSTQKRNDGVPPGRSK